MNKKTTWRLVIPLAGLLFVVLACFFAKIYNFGVLTSGLQAADIAQVKAVEKIEVDGCKPAQKHEKQLGVIEYRLDSIDEKQEDLVIEQKEMRKENKDAFKEILERLPP